MPHRGFLGYLQLALLLGMAVFLIYVLFYLHEIPHRIACRRNHPRRDAILTPGSKGFMSDANTQLMLQDIALLAMAAIAQVQLVAGGARECLKLPGGSVGQATIHTGEFPLTNLLRRVLLRIDAWRNYLFLP